MPGIGIRRKIRKDEIRNMDCDNFKELPVIIQVSMAI